MKKVLFTATVDSHILHFHVPYLKRFKEAGFEVHVASNGTSVIPYVDVKYNVPFARTPFSISNLRSFLQIHKIIRESEFVLIHCHTPVAGALTRLAAKGSREFGTRIFYTAHGFHFYKGAPLINWLMYFPIEKWLSRYTDCLITINTEDYATAIQYQFRANYITKVNGVGVDLSKYTPQTVKEKERLRMRYGYSADDFILISVAELNKNKNQLLLIDIVEALKNKIPSIKLLLIGNGELAKYYEQRVDRLKLKQFIHFMGYRRDIPQLLKMSDVFISTSRREGLPLSILEAMATGLPIVASNCRGNRDLVMDGVNGYLCSLKDVQGFSRAVESLHNSAELRIKLGGNSLVLAKKYDITDIVNKVSGLYQEFIRGRVRTVL